MKESPAKITGWMCTCRSLCSMKSNHERLLTARETDFLKWPSQNIKKTMSKRQQALMLRQWGTSIQNCYSGNSLVVQWLGLHAFTAEGASSIPGRGTKIPQAMQRSQKQKQTQTNRQNRKQNPKTATVYNFIFINVFCFETVIFLFTFRFIFIKITLVYNIIRFMCTTLYFYFCIAYSMLTTKNLVSIHHHTVNPFYPFHPPHHHNFPW